MLKGIGGWGRAAALTPLATGLIITTLTVATQAETVPAGAVQEASSLRDVFGINAPDAQGDATDRLRRKNQAPDLMPRQEGDIPEVSARDSGPRIIVKQFTFDRLEEFPEFKITREGVEAEAERLRVIYMKEDQRREDGYTPEEVNEITGYLKDIGGQSSVDDLTHEDMQALVELVREQNRNRGLSFADLEEIANRLTLYYRERGLFLARVLLPAQEVKDGVVRFTVMEGRLGQLETYGNRKYSDATLKSPLEPLVGGIVTSQEVVESLYIINDLPGLKVTGAFSAGDNPGETRLKLAVREEDNLAFLVRLDNHGSTYTGKARLYTNMQWFNPIGFGDSLSLGYMRTEDPGDNKVDTDMIDGDDKPQAHSNLGQFRYSFPFFSLRNRISLSADRNTFDLVDESGGIINALELSGVNTNYSVRFDHQLVRTRDFNMSVGLAATDKKSTVNSFVDFLSTEDHVKGGAFNFYIDGLSQGGIRMLNTANLSVQYGEFQNEVREGADQTFMKGGLDTNSLFFIRLPFTDTYSRLLTSMRLQHSDQSLPSFEQMALGGANAVRGFSTGDFSADKAAFISNEWYFNLPSWQLTSSRTFNDVFQTGLLLDMAHGTQNGGFITDSGTQAADEWAYMISAGLVFKATWGSTFSSKLSIATPIDAKASTDPKSADDGVERLNDNPDAVEVFIDMNFAF